IVGTRPTDLPTRRASAMVWRTSAIVFTTGGSIDHTWVRVPSQGGPRLCEAHRGRGEILPVGLEDSAHPTTTRRGFRSVPATVAGTSASPVRLDRVRRPLSLRPPWRRRRAIPLRRFPPRRTCRAAREHPA